MKAMAVNVALFVILSSQAYAQVPVTDATSIEQQVKTQVETMAKWKMQYDQMISQIEQAKQQYEALTGTRGLGQIMDDPALRDYLPSDWQTVYDDVRNSGYKGLSGRGAQIYNETKVFDSCAHIAVEDQRKVCEAQAVKAAQDKGLVLDAYDVAKTRINQIDQLMGQINNTQDPKAIAELQARIAVEQANIQNEQTKLQLYSMIAAAEDRVLAQRQREIQARTWSARGGIDVKPLTFK